MADVEKNEQPTQPTTMDDRLQKFFELRLARNERRKQNQEAIKDEDKKEKQISVNEEKEKRIQNLVNKRKLEAMVVKGEYTEVRDKLLSVTAEDAEWMVKKKKKKRDEDNTVDVTSSRTHYYAFKRRMISHNVNSQEYQEAKESQKDFYRDANNLNYGQAPIVPEENVDRMIDELDKTIQRRKSFNRRRTFFEEADIDYINERNRVFNKKIARAFDKYTTEIKQNLERGTAI
eukprot:TRINITY_DN18758_c0_g1_i1.p1 TRINITY_DN18758_c0_g1~~TRINITY_DN18758_c0_g1_i1.p1  ORF type:complete len:232 (-),score=59.47 TRINITY_DN18758_c0_g1_i1:8-703(-)